MTDKVKGKPVTRSTVDVLHLIEEATAADTGQEYFEALVRNVAKALNLPCTFIARFSDDLEIAHVRAFWLGDGLIENYDYTLADTPCELVLAGEPVCIQHGVADQFPEHRKDLEAIHANSYLAVPLRAKDGRVIGHLAVIDSVKRNWPKKEIAIMRIFAARATAELEHETYENKLKATNKELRLTKESAENASRSKSDFLATMSHELRTPLNGILGYAQILQRDQKLDANQKRGVDTIKHCAEQLLALISDVLDLAKVGAGKLALHAVVFNLAEFIDSVAEMGRMDAQRSGLGFVYETRANPPEFILADERRLRQILLNLLSNAVKFTDDGAVTLRADCRKTPGGRTLLCFEVEDTGIGIAADQLENIFGRFEQAHQRHSSRAQSTGLGLTISRTLARAMDGDVLVKSEVGKGSRFMVEILVSEASAAHAMTEKPRDTMAAYSGVRRRVLVVDDEPNNRDVLRSLLSSVGFEVDVAVDGPGALKAVADQAPDLIIMDMVMPGLSGIETLQRLRATPGGERIPAIAVSASTLEGTWDASIGAGFFVFLPKPLRFDSLLEHIGEALDITWIASRNSALPSSPAPTPVGTEPANRQGILAAIYESAQLGDIRAVQAALDEFSRLAKTDDPLLVRLRALAEHYDMNGIRTLLAPGNTVAM